MRYEYSQGTSHKFWQIEQRGKVLHIAFGRIGSEGQTVVKRFASPAAATQARDKLAREKTRKGYKPTRPTADATIATRAKTAKPLVAGAKQPKPAIAKAAHSKPSVARSQKPKPSRTQTTAVRGDRGGTATVRADAIGEILRRAAGAAHGMTELGTIDRPGVVIAADGLPGYHRGKPDKRGKATRSVTLDLRGWPAATVFRIDSGFVFAKLVASTSPELSQLLAPLRDMIYSRTLNRRGVLDVRSGVLSLLPPGREVAADTAKLLATAAMSTVNGSALVLSVVGAGNCHGAVSQPGGLALAAAPSQYAVWEDATLVEGAYGRIERRILITFDPTIGEPD